MTDDQIIMDLYDAEDFISDIIKDIKSRDYECASQKIQELNDSISTIDIFLRQNIIRLRDVND